MSQLSFELENKQSFITLLQTVEKMKGEKKNTQLDLEQKKQMELRQQKIVDKQDELNKLTSVYKELKDKVVKKKIENLTLGVKDEAGIMDDMIYEAGIMDDMIYQTQIRKAEIKQIEAGHLQNEVQDKLKLLQTQLTEEKGAHEEAMKFLQNRNKELQQQLNSWKQRLEEMLQDKQNQVSNVKRKRTLNSDKREELERKIKEMEQVVMEDMKEKERLLQQEAEIRAATKVTTQSEHTGAGFYCPPCLTLVRS
ncbi:calponin homology domain-containing protein DDB_G0272472, partial [Austrofundulus limnaeus]|uniref:Calponin homology domain-containing protein DDB_G0272472 n=1 Tax=Austrofundulus limnaeus TaxID=52670 RepID=A0A2I4BKU8_AUSLI